MVSDFNNLIKVCRISNTGVDSDQYPVQQVSYLGKAVASFIAMPYGSHANLPVNELGILLQISTQEQNRAVIPLSPKRRPKGLAPGEVVYYHPITGSKIHFRNNGDIDVTAPNTNLAGNVTISGNLNVAGNSTLNTVQVSGQADFNGGIFANGVDIGETHAHSGVSTGAASSGPVVP